MPYWVTFMISLASGALLWLMGRAVISASGHVWWWYGGLGTPESNMHLTDWYTPSHVIHGILFYAALWLVARRLSLGWRLALATLVEAGWEVLENTNAVIERYRNTTVSSDYIGDSVVNSTADIAAMLLGFWLARRLPIWASIAIVVGFELLTTALIRDGLALNVIMLLWPSDAILTWQAGG
ncbi:UPF0314 protein [Sinisalibacter aestuarii]|uniref:UPF0314 protein n=1 Tax=Sinisalibacter aestuarii TaxID=2949426 RepID=A0ABQ5LQW9_9RHOB|nr:UPF0314 protein [Sinisalibacter aestuarii]